VLVRGSFPLSFSSSRAQPPHGFQLEDPPGDQEVDARQGFRPAYDLTRGL
jgi:hypothetical protein